MVVLSRKKNESVIIEDNITVTVIDIRPDKVRLGFVHPKEVSVHRQEVYEAIHGRVSAQKQNESTPAQNQEVHDKQNEPTPANPEQAIVLLSSRHITFVDHLAAAWQQSTGSPVTRGMVIDRILDAVEKVGTVFPWNG